MSIYAIISNFFRPGFTLLAPIDQEDYLLDIERKLPKWCMRIWLWAARREHDYLDSQRITRRRYGIWEAFKAQQALECAVGSDHDPHWVWNDFHGTKYQCRRCYTDLPWPEDKSTWPEN